MRRFTQVLTIVLVLGVAAQTSHASWGYLDATFGCLGGVVDTNAASHYPYGLAVQPDGKILVTGYRLVSGKRRFFLRRYLSNGQVDTSFGNNGSAISYALIIVNADYYGQKIVVQDNGRIAVSGIGNNVPVVWRFHASGYADTSFGGGGMKSLSTYESYYPSIATYSNILYVGVVEEGTQSTVILKFNSNGTQDTSFGSSGEALTGADGRGFSMATEPSTGNILIGARQLNTTGYGVQRFLPTGLVDSTFDNFGATYNGYVGYYPTQFVTHSDGRFTMNQRSLNLGGMLTIFADLVHLSSNGTATGTTPYEPLESVPYLTGSCPDIMALQQDGRLVVKGLNNDELFRFSTDFASVNTMTCSSYANLGYPRSPAVLQSDDKMIAAGTYNGYLAMLRTLP